MSLRIFQSLLIYKKNVKLKIKKLKKILMGINIAQGIKNYHFILNIYLIYSRLIGQLPVDFRLTSGEEWSVERVVNNCFYDII